MVRKPRIEVIQIGLDNLDIEKEIREKTDKIIVDTNRLGNLRPVSKKDRDAAQWSDRVKRIADLLIEAESQDRFVPSTEIISKAEITLKQLGGLITRVRKYLRRDDVWSLHKKTIKGLTHYHLMKFGAD